MPETSTITDIRSTVIQSRSISRDVSIITLHCPAIAVNAKPGNFVNVKINSSTQPLLRRPFSIHHVEYPCIDIMVKSIGCGTALFCNTPEGSTVMVLGPLGNCFDIEGNGFDTAVLVSGGIGTAPMRFLESALEKSGKKVVNLIGGRSGEDLLTLNLSNCMIATDDGSEGFRGTVVELLGNALPQLEKDGRLKVFACGPTPMLKALARFCRENALPAELSLESIMGCGIGICYGCSVEVSSPDEGNRTILLCREGPVIDAGLLVV